MEDTFNKSLNTWDYNTLPDYFTIALFAKRRSGKTFLCRYISYNLRKRFTDAYLFSHTADMNKDFEFIPKENRYNHLNIGKLQEIRDEQMDAIKRHEKDKSVKIKTPLLIFDDIIGDPKVRKDQEFLNLFTLGRHLKLNTIIISQSMGGKAGIPLVARSNLDCSIAFYLNAEYDKKLFISQFLSTKSYKEGEQVFNKTTAEKHTAIVIDCSNLTGREYHEYCYQIKADVITSKFIIGKKKYNVLTDNTPKVELDEYTKKSKDNKNNKVFLNIELD